jgi:hypothetical protein
MFYAATSQACFPVPQGWKAPRGHFLLGQFLTRQSAQKAFQNRNQILEPKPDFVSDNYPKGRNS